MKVLIDIGHPADVHLFKNLAWILEKKGHKILFTTKDKECCVYLLGKYGFDYIILGKFFPGFLGKIKCLPWFTLKTLNIARKFKPDLLLSHGSISLAFVSRLIGKNHISMEDTGNLEQIFLYWPFAKVILSPESLRLNLGRKHIKYKGYHELAYLHPKYFNPDRHVLDILGVKDNEKFVILRFSAHAATHDFRYHGIPLKFRIKCVEEFSRYAKVFISSEANIDTHLEKFKIIIPPEKMHDAFYYASLVYSEGAKSASEASVLGTPAIYVYFKCCDYIADQKKYGNIFSFTNKIDDIEKSIQKGVGLLNESDAKAHHSTKRNQIVNDNIDLTAFMVWFITAYPESSLIMKQRPDYQYNFK
jgi:hypothetical protein